MDRDLSGLVLPSGAGVFLLDDLDYNGLMLRYLRVIANYRVAKLDLV